MHLLFQRFLMVRDLCFLILGGVVEVFCAWGFRQLMSSRRSEPAKQQGRRLSLSNEASPPFSGLLIL